MTWIIVLLLFLVGLFFSGFFSGCETGLYCANRLRIELGARDSDPNALRLQRVLADEQGALSVTLIGTNVSNYVVTTAVAYGFAAQLDLSGPRAELYTVAMVTPIVFVFGEVVPKNLFQLYADYLMGVASVPLMCAIRFCRAAGLVRLLKLLVAGADRLTGSMAADVIATPRRRVAALLQDALAERVQGAEQSELVDKVVRLAETPVHAVMVPRNRVTTIHADADRTEFLPVARRTGHARLPVFDGTRVRVIGIINVDELLRRDDWSTVSDCLQTVPSIGPHATVANAIRTLQELRRSLAIVTDSGGRMLGIVTLTDLLEELVG